MESKNKFKNNSLEAMLFVRLDSTRLSWSKYLVISLMDFAYN